MSDVTEKLAAAWKAVQDAEIPESLQGTAFKFALGLTATPAGSGLAAGPPTAEPGEVDGRGARAGAGTDTSDAFPLAEFCRKIGRNTADAEQVIHIADDGTLSVVATPKALAKGSRIKNAQRVMCLYVAYQRYISDRREVPVEEVRPLLQSVDLLDTKNFKGTHIKGVPGVKLNGEKFIPVTNLATAAGAALDELVAAENNT